MVVTKRCPDSSQLSDRRGARIRVENICPKCYIKIRDIKLLTQHYWRVHIQLKDQVDAVRVLKTNETLKLKTSDASLSLTPSPSGPLSSAGSVAAVTNKSTPSKSVKRLNNKRSPVKASPKPKKRTTSKLSSSIEESEFYPCEINLDSLTNDEIKHYNLLKHEIDEANIAQRVESLYSNIPYDKSKLFYQ